MVTHILSLVKPILYGGLVCLCWALTIGNSIGQSTDNRPLFWIDEDPVTVGEFMYIYNKNNTGQLTTTSTKPEYLDLYKNFKLKVHHARALKMDTISKLRTELKGYREQLADTYMSDDKVMQRLVREAYDRMSVEVEISHILISIGNQDGRADTSQAYAQASAIYRDLEKRPQDWSDIVKSTSNDQGNKDDDGYIGFIKAPLPKGYYALESAIYRTADGDITTPIRSPRGYHIIKVISRRPARPQVEVAHIFIEKKKDNSNADTWIQTIYQQLQGGASFEDLVKTHSEDKKTKSDGGRIGFIETGMYEPEFESAVYALSQDGEVSPPVETRVGYHIIKRLSIKPLLSFEKEKRKIENEIRTSERATMAKDAMVQRISREEGLVMNRATVRTATDAIDETLFSYRWKRPVSDHDAILLSYTNQERTLGDFYTYLEQNPKHRVQYKSLGLDGAIKGLVLDFITHENLALERSRLEDKHPEFAALMREYEEGILLFEITKDYVWDIASNDTAGLRAYFNDHRTKYAHPRKAQVFEINLPNLRKKNLNQVKKLINKSGVEGLKSKYPDVAINELTISEDDPQANTVSWKAGTLGPARSVIGSDIGYNIAYTKEVSPSQLKKLNECRGYVIADYQAALETEWIQMLKSKYPIHDNQKVVNQVIYDK